MSEISRYAVYYAPPQGSALAAFGASWLGWDADAGEARRHPNVDGVAIAALTATPRKYGFHGTLKPPFRLAEGVDRDTVEQAVSALAAQRAPFDGPALDLRRIGAFLALVPSEPCAALADLAAACVQELDVLRRPAEEAELARRRKAGLSPRQEDLLVRWGYPYILDEFRFHLTLTGPLANTDAERAHDVLRPLTQAFHGEPIPVREVCLFGERADGFFQILQRFPLGQ